MDFGYLMDLAQQNKNEALNQRPLRSFPSQLSKAKKLDRSNVNQSAVNNFLAKRQREERLKLKRAEDTKERLLSLRAQEKGSGRRVSAMLNRNKAANKSVLDDARDQYNTAATLNGSYQPDTDDYGYVSKESEAMYAKLLHKYESLPDKDYLNSKNTRKKRSLDLTATKARVKDSLDRQEFEERDSKGHRKRRSKDGTGDPAVSECQAKSDGDRSGGQQAASSRKSAAARGSCHQKQPPPGLDFNSIMRLAAEKQGQLASVPAAEATQSEIESALQKRQEQQRPMTASQKKEAELERVRKLRRCGKLPPARSTAVTNSVESAEKSSDDNIGAGAAQVGKQKQSASVTREQRRPVSGAKSAVLVEPGSRDSVKGSIAGASSAERAKSGAKVPAKMSADSKNGRSQTTAAAASTDLRSAVSRRTKSDLSTPTKRPANSASSLRSDTRRSADINSANCDDVRGRTAEPRRGPIYTKSGHELATPGSSKSRRIESDSEEEEYDSEMDDFIDDGPLNPENDYSSAIRDIFGYDKSKFRDEDDDVSDMEADFGTVMMEERRSTKIAEMEDSEELRKEIAHKKRKMALKSNFR